METITIPFDWAAIICFAVTFITYSAWVWNKGRKYGVKINDADHKAREAEYEKRVARQKESEQDMVYLTVHVKIHFQADRPATVDFYPKVQATLADAKLLASYDLPELEARVLADPEVATYLENLERSMSLCEDVMRIGGYFIRPENITRVVTSYWYSHHAPRRTAPTDEEVNPYE